MGRHVTYQGAGVLAANNLTLGSDGNAFCVSGPTPIHAIDTTGWPNGSVVTILPGVFSPTIKNGQSAVAPFASIQLAGGLDFPMGQLSTLTLLLNNGVWFETGRKAT